MSEAQLMPRSNGQIQQRTPAQQFGVQVTNLAERELVNLFGSEQGKAAAARVALAFRAAASTAKNPNDFYDCSPTSVASALATSAFTQIMPGGPFTGCWLIPKKVNGVQTLNWWINHRGIKTLARRAGQAIEAIPYFTGDEVVIRRGQNWSVDVLEGECSDRDSFAQLEGFVYYVTDLQSGMLLAARKVSKALILKRKAKGQAGNVWTEWPMEMAEKTVIKFAAGRGDVFFDDVGNMALSREAEAIDVPSERVSTERVTNTPAARAIADAGRVNEIPDQREAVEQERNEEADAEEEQIRAPRRANAADIARTVTAAKTFGLSIRDLEARVQRGSDAWTDDDLSDLGTMLREARAAKSSKPVTDDEGA